MSEWPKLLLIAEDCYLIDDGPEGWGADPADGSEMGTIDPTYYHSDGVPWLPKDQVVTLEALALVMESDAKWKDLEGLLNKQIIGKHLREILNALKVEK